MEYRELSQNGGESPRYASGPHEYYCSDSLKNRNFISLKVSVQLFIRYVNSVNKELLKRKVIK